MEKTQKVSWTVWFRACENNWIGILAKRKKKTRYGVNAIHLSHNGHRFAASKEYDSFKKLKSEEQSEILSQIKKAMSMGWIYKEKN